MGFHTVTLQNVRINSSLCKELNSLKLSSFFCKHIDKLFADDFALLLRIAHTCQFIQKTVDGIHIDQVGTQLVPEYTDNLFWLAFAEQTMVHVNAYQLVTDGLDQQSGYNR